MEESVSTFQSVVYAEQQNGGTQKKIPLDRKRKPLQQVKPGAGDSSIHQETERSLRPANIRGQWLRGRGMWEKPHRKGSDTQREGSLQASTNIHLQGNVTFIGP